MIPNGRGLLVSVVLLLGLLLPSCGAETAFIIAIANTWEVVDDAGQPVPNHSYNFDTVDPDGEVSAATFLGEESRNSVPSELSGSFNQTAITFIVERAAGDVTFTGTILDNDNMTIASVGGAESYNLRRQIN